MSKVRLIGTDGHIGGQVVLCVLNKGSSVRASVRGLKISQEIL